MLCRIFLSSFHVSVDNIARNMLGGVYKDMNSYNPTVNGIQF